jgi:TonB-dependent starch-binding outer membrane protein SusC
MKSFTHSWLRTFLIIALVACSGWAVAQQRTVTGRVTDASSKAAIPFASVVIKGATTGTTTDENGRFTVNVPGDATVLIFASVGYQRKEITVGTQTTINVELESSYSDLNEVVIVGYGTQVKREITGSITKVSGDKIMGIQVPSFEAALQGQAAGVQVIQGSGLAGSGSVIRVRGLASVSSVGDPLYVVDGIPITNDNFLAKANWQNGAFNNNPLAAINPNDIESIEILKDAAAAGIYGSRGANGVILITTKRGQTGKPQFNFSANVGTSDPTARPNLVDGPTWLKLYQEAWENDGNTGPARLPNDMTWEEAQRRSISYARLMRERYGISLREAFSPTTDWWGLLTQTGIKQNYDFSSSWGKSNYRGYVGISYANNDSYIKGNNFERMSGRANFDFDIARNLNMAVSTSFTQGINRRVRVAYTGGIGDAMSVALPIYPVFEADSSWFRRGANPLFQAENFEGYTIDNRTINNVMFTYTPIENMRVNVSGGYDYLDQRNDQWESGELINQPTSLGRAVRDIRWVKNYNVGANAEYDLMVNSIHRFKFLGGMEYQQSVTSGKNNIVYNNVGGTLWSNNNEFGSGSVFESDQLFVLNNDRWSFMSFFARANYTLKDRYILQGTIRSDGSSRFGSNNRFGIFPVVSGAWIASEEDFLKSSSALSFLKLKASFGITGNSNIPSNQWIGTYRYIDASVYNGQPILFPERVPNPNLKWETTQNIDLGFEIGFLNDRISLEGSYFHRLTRDVIMNLTVPQSSGFGNFWDNIGEIKNEGFDLTLNTVNIDKNNFRWNTNFNVGYVYNEVLSIGNYTEDAVSGGTNDTRIVVGYPVGTNYLIRYSRVDPATGRPIYLDGSGRETFIYDEQNDRVPVGDVLPDLYGGFGNTLSYKNFSLNALFVFTVGGKIYDSSSKRQMTFLSDWNIREDVGDRWRQPGDIAKYPKLTLNPAEHGNTKEWFNTDVWLHDGSFVRLRNLAFSYQIPNNLLNRLGLRTAALTLSGTNLLTFTKFPGLDPEIARDFDNVTDRNMSPNITYLTPPQERSFNFTINVGF